MTAREQTALARALALQADAARLGFDWPTLGGILGKIMEEAAELGQAIDGSAGDAAIAEELGDLLFVLVNLARRLELAPEHVLHAACDKFERRFAFVRAELAQRGVAPEEAGLDELERLWQLAKQAEEGRAGRLPKPL